MTIPVIICAVVAGANFCVPALGGKVDSSRYHLVQRLPCADCVPPSGVDTFRDSKTCIVAEAGVVVAAARVVKADHMSTVDEFLDLTVEKNVLMISMPRVRNYRAIVMAHLSECLRTPTPAK
jgi:hypothetical protein